MAYEKKGDIKRALENYKLAAKAGNKSATGAVNRLENNGKKDKTTSFNNATKKMNTRAFMKSIYKQKQSNHIG